MKKNLRPYQVELSVKGATTLKHLNVVYLRMEVRTGKTATALQIAKLCRAKRVLFITKLKAIPSILSDYQDFNFDRDFELTVINDESLHHIKEDFDLVIHDEHHRYGSLCKPGVYAKNFKKRFSKKPMIFLSGTPTPESYSQIYHQFWVSDHSPFKDKNFYKWYDAMGCNKLQFQMGFATVADYSGTTSKLDKYISVELRKSFPADVCAKTHADLKERQLKAEAKIKELTSPYYIDFSQVDAGFESSVQEHFLTCKMSQATYDLVKRLKKDRVIQGKKEVILADTAVKLMIKTHQLYSGTIKFESGASMVTDTAKAVFIKDYFKTKKIGIFYKFQAELDMLKDIFGDKLCCDLTTFDKTDKHIALQIVSGREGISLKSADCLVYLNIDFSAVSYFQSKDRMTTMTRTKNDIYWVFAEGGIEREIYRAVSAKKDYTLAIFNRGLKTSDQVNKRV